MVGSWKANFDKRKLCTKAKQKNCGKEHSPTTDISLSITYIVIHRCERLCRIRPLLTRVLAPSPEWAKQSCQNVSDMFLIDARKCCAYIKKVNYLYVYTPLTQLVEFWEILKHHSRPKNLATLLYLNEGAFPSIPSCLVAGAEMSLSGAVIPPSHFALPRNKNSASVQRPAAAVR